MKNFVVFVFYMQLSIGADPQRTKRNFRGCLENLLYNGLNMLESAKIGHSHQVALVVSIYSRKTLPRSHDLWSWIAGSGSLEMILRKVLDRKACSCCVSSTSRQFGGLMVFCFLLYIATVGIVLALDR